jgi:hypothetical protein
MAKKALKKDDKLNLESILFNCRDYLRSNAALNDKRDLLITLVFSRFIGEKFEDAQEIMRNDCINNGIEDETIIEAFLNSPSRYQSVAVSLDNSITDPDNGIVGYRYELFETSSIVGNINEILTEFYIKLFVCDNYLIYLHST